MPLHAGYAAVIELLIEPQCIFLLFKDYTQLENALDLNEAIKQTVDLNKVSMTFEEVYYIFNELKLKSFDQTYKQHQKLS